ncbi:hypothetical protein D3C71_1413900 [compost metagenome]
MVENMNWLFEAPVEVFYHVLESLACVDLVEVALVEGLALDNLEEFHIFLDLCRRRNKGCNPVIDDLLVTVKHEFSLKSFAPILTLATSKSSFDVEYQLEIILSVLGVLYHQIVPLIRGHLIDGIRGGRSN